MNFNGMANLQNDRFLTWANGIVYLTFGKFEGEALEDVAYSNPAYLNFMITCAIPEEVKEYFQEALDQLGE